MFRQFGIRNSIWNSDFLIREPKIVTNYIKINICFNMKLSG